jgi:hypothetical protein
VLLVLVLIETGLKFFISMSTGSRLRDDLFDSCSCDEILIESKLRVLRSSTYSIPSDCFYGVEFVETGTDYLHEGHNSFLCVDKKSIKNLGTM